MDVSRRIRGERPVLDVLLDPVLGVRHEEVDPGVVLTESEGHPEEVAGGGE